MQRSVHVGRGRRSGVIVGTRPMVPASVVPEELISQVCTWFRSPVNRIVGVMVSMLAPSAIDREFEPWFGQIDVCYFSGEHAALVS